MATLTVRTVDQLDPIDADGVKEAGDENSRFLLQSDGHPYSMTVGVAKQLFGTAGSGSGSGSGGDDPGTGSGSITSEVNQIDSYSKQMSYKAEDVKNLFEVFTVEEDVLNVTVHAYATFAEATDGINQITVEIRTVKPNPDNPGQPTIEWVPVCRSFTKGTFLQIDKHLCLYNGVSFRVAGYDRTGAEISVSSGRVYVTYVNPSGREIGGSQKTFVVSFAKVGDTASPEVEMPNQPGIVEAHVRASMGDMYDSWCYARALHLQVKGSTTNGNYRNMGSVGYSANTTKEVDLVPFYVSPGDKLRIAFGAKSTAHSRTGAWPANTAWFTWTPINSEELTAQYPGIKTSAETDFSGATILRYGVKKNPKKTTVSPLSPALTSNQSETAIGVCNAEFDDQPAGWAYTDISCGGGVNSSGIRFSDWSVMRLNPAGSSGAWGYLTNGVNTDLPGNYVLKFNNLKSVTFSNTYIPSWYRTLSGITLGDTLTALDDNCFQWLSNWVPVGPDGELSTFVVPANIERMSMTRTFRNCRKIKRIVFEKAKNIKETSGTDIGMFATFMQCYGLTAIEGLSDLTAVHALSAYSFAYTQVTRLDLRNIVQLGNSSMTSANEPFLSCSNLANIALDFYNISSDAFSISPYLFASTKAKKKNGGIFKIRILNVPENVGESDFKQWAINRLQGIATFKNNSNVIIYGIKNSNFESWDTFSSDWYVTTMNG